MKYLIFLSSSDRLSDIARVAVLAVTEVDATEEPHGPVDGRSLGRELGLEAWRGETEPLGAKSILCDVTIVEQGKPAGGIDVFEIDISARVGLVAADDTWRKNAIGRDHVAQGDVLHSNKSLSLALLEDWVEHAPWTVSIRLFLLLRTDVDTPPDRHVYLKIFVKNVCYLSVSNVTWVGLDIHSLEWLLKINISEGYISNAGMLNVRRHRSNGHTDTPVHNSIFNSNICSAVSDLVSLIGRLDSYSIVKVCDGQVLHVDVATTRVNTISIQREGRDIELVVVLAKALC